MEKWRTEIKLDKGNYSINHADSSIFIGSCFSENIAEKFAFYGLDVEKNPLGILYNPVSIADNLEGLLRSSLLDPKGFIERQNHVFHTAFHSDFFGESQQDLEKKWRDAQRKFQNFWAKARYLFITLGTAHVYTYKETGQIAGNCHKLSASYFDKSLLTHQEIKASLEKIKSFCIGKKLILTLSPVRHLKDGIVENSRSKANLLSAIHEFCDQNDVYYFPSYEIMMDDLRDYRFYKTDMLHPTDQAISYIWEKFSNVFFETKTQETFKTIANIRARQMHRPNFPESQEHRYFLEALHRDMVNLTQENPNIRLK